MYLQSFRAREECDWLSVVGAPPQVESFTPNIRIRHRAKPVEVWLTRSGAVVLSLEERGVSLGVRLPPREGLRWREAPQPGVDTPEDEERATRRDGIYALRRESPGCASPPKPRALRCASCLEKASSVFITCTSHIKIVT